MQRQQNDSRIHHRGMKRAVLSGGSVLATVAALVSAAPLHAGPQGEQVVAGSASFNRQGDLTHIEAGHNTIINYDSFDIAGHETVQFLQPNADARVLNRVLNADPTQINGQLLANGRVYIINQAGVRFGDGAVVNVGQLYAAAANMGNDQFLSGIDAFTDAQGSVINHGQIRADAAVLFGRHVQNTGSILIDGGMLALASGDSLYLQPRDGHIMLRIESAGAGAGGDSGDAGRPGVSNAGTLDAGGGHLTMAAGDAFGAVAYRDSVMKGAQVTVDAHGGEAQVAGTIDATNATGDGGRVAVLGERVTLDGALIDASGATRGGEVLIGGDFQGNNPDVRNARTTLVRDDVTILADALNAGDGGRVIVWADEGTSFAGHIAARGGEQGGDGGFTEVSSKGRLWFDGTVDLTAMQGAKGTLLLDPKNIEIVNASGESPVSDHDEFADNPTETSQLNDEDVEAALDGADLVLEANNDITVSHAVDATGNTGDGNLTLLAGRSIQFDADLTLKGSLTAIANDTGAQAANRDAGDAVIAMGTGVTIDTSAGPDAANQAITLQYGDGPNGDDATGAMSLDTLNAGGGDIMLDTAANDGGAASVEDITVAGTVETTGSVIISDADTVTFQDDITLGTLDTSSGNAFDVALHGDTNTIAADTTFQNTGSVTIGNEDSDIIEFTGGLDTTGNPTGTHIAGEVRTDGSVIDLGDVTLAGDASVDATGGGSTPAGADVTFHSNVSGDALLTANAGTDGAASFTTTVGSGTPLSGMFVEGSAVDFGSTVAVDDEGLEVTAGSGGANFADTVTTANGGTVTIKNNGPLTFATIADFNLDGAFVQDGESDVLLNADITTSGDTIDFTGNVISADGVTLSTGAGTPADITFDGNLSPNGGDPGTLNIIGDLVLTSGATYTVQLDGTTAGSGYDQIDVTGDVDINGAALDASLGFGASAGDAFDIIVNADGVAGAFDGQVDDSTITVGPADFEVDYDAPSDSGNDVRLTRLLARLIWDGDGGDNLWSNAANWVGDLLTPGDGDQVIFPDDIATAQPENDILNLELGGITFRDEGGINTYTLIGNEVELAGDVTNESTNPQIIDFALTLAPGINPSFDAAAGLLDFRGAIAGPSHTLTVTGGHDVTFGSSVTASNLQLQSTAGTIRFLDDLVVSGGLTTSADAFDVQIVGANNTIAGDTDFTNTGSVTVGDETTDATEFTGGLDTTGNPSGTDIAGEVRTVNAAMDLGATTLTDDAALISGSEAINVASITDGPNFFTLALQEDAAGATGDVTFAGNLDVDGLATFARGYDVNLHGSNNTIISPTDFQNTGSVTFGNDASDLTQFASGVDTTGGPIDTRLAGTLDTVDSPINLGSTTLTDDATVRSGSGVISFASSVSGAAETLTLQEDAAGSTGDVTFAGDVVLLGLTTFAQDYDIALHGSTNSISSATSFLNTGSVTLGNDAADTTTFISGLDTTDGPDVTNIAGTVASHVALDLGATMLTADAALQADGTVTVASATDGGAGHVLTLQDDTIDSAGTSVVFEGDVNLGGLKTFARSYDVALLGSNNTINSEVIFANTSGVVLGDEASDTTLFTGGVTSTASPTSIAGAVHTQGQAMSFGSLDLTADTTLDTTNNDTVSTGATIALNEDVTGGGSANFTVDAGTAGNVAAGASDLGVSGGDELAAVVIQRGDTVTINAINADSFDAGSAASLGSFDVFDNVAVAGDVTIDAAGNIALQDVATTGMQHYTTGGAVFLYGDTYTTTDSDWTADGVAVLFEPTTHVSTGGGSGDVTFAGPVEAGLFPDPIDLNVQAGSGDVRFDGNVGAGAPLHDLTVAGRNITTRSLYTQDGDITLDASREGNDDLLPLHLSFAGLNPVGIITTDGNVIASNGDVLLNTAGSRDFVPVRTTVVFEGGGAAIQGNNITLGQNEKLSVVDGGLSINASSTATLGDLNANGSISIAAAQTIFLGRDQGSLLTPTLGMIPSDIGVDIVADGTVDLSAANVQQVTDGKSLVVAVPSAGAYAGPLGALAGGGSVQPLTQQRSFQILSDLQPGVIDQPLVLDLVASGVSETNRSTSLAPAIPRIRVAVAQPVSLVGTHVDLLREIGIIARAPTLDELRSAIREHYARYQQRAVYVDSPTTGDYDVAAPRLWNQQVELLVERLTGTFFVRRQDGTLEYRGDTVQRVLEQSLDAYRESTGEEEVDPEAWVAFLLADSAQQPVVDELRGIQGVLEAVRLLGLTGEEREIVISTLLRGVQPSALGLDAFRDALQRASEMENGIVGTDPEEAVELQVDDVDEMSGAPLRITPASERG